MSEIKIIFSIYSKSTEIDFDELTQVAGCSPTSFWKKGEHIRNSLFRKETAWEYQTPYIFGYDIDPLVSNIMSVIKKPEILGQYCKSKNLEVKIEFVIESIKETFPSICFTKEFIKFCSALNSWIDVDVTL